LHYPGAKSSHLQTYGVMGTLDDAIREHLDLKRRLGASDEELKQKETEAFGAGEPRMAAPPSDGAPAGDAPERAADLEPEPAASIEEAPPPADRWERPDDLLDPDEVLPEDSLERNGSLAPPPPVERRRAAEPEEPHEDPFDEWEEEPAPTEDVLQETPEFLEETPEHDRLWFEQKPPKDFDFD
jgi:hypothetical protein